jgi:protease-4
MHDYILKLIKNSVHQFLTAIIVMAMFVALMLIALSIIGNIAQSKPSRKDAVLTIDMGMEIFDTPEVQSPFGQLFDKQGPNRAALLAMTDAIYKAADDKHIKGILLSGARPMMPDTSLATIMEVRDALAYFRETGKPIYAYVQDTDIREYAFASAADHIWMNPTSALGMEGFAFQRLYFGEAFQRYGVGVQTASAGKYKSAPDTFGSDHMSDADREQIEAFLKDVRASYNELIAESRSVPLSLIEDIETNVGLVPAKTALERKLVDKLAYYDELIGEMQALGGADGDYFRAMDIRAYMGMQEKPSISSIFPISHSTVHVEYVEGEIVDGGGSLEQAGCDRIVDNLRSVRNDKRVKALVLRVNSPGGSVIASEKIRREVELISGDIPVVVSMGGMAASGGYWVSAPAKTIFAEPTTLTGSIGVFSMLIDIKKLAENWGVRAETVATSPYAGMYSPFSHKDEKQMQVFRDAVDDFYNQFLHIVAKGRKMDVDKVSAVAEGRIWSGTAAQKIGLVDEIGSLDDAINAAAALANLGDNYSVEDSAVERSFMDEFNLLLSARVQAATATPASKMNEEIKAVANQAADSHFFARLPFFTQGTW